MQDYQHVTKTPVVWKHIQKQVKEVQNQHECHIILLRCRHPRSMGFSCKCSFVVRMFHHFLPTNPKRLKHRVRPAAKVSSDPLPQRHPRRSRSATALVKSMGPKGSPLLEALKIPLIYTWTFRRVPNGRLHPLEGAGIDCF